MLLKNTSSGIESLRIFKTRGEMGKKYWSASEHYLPQLLIWGEHDERIAFLEHA